jgi:uncharacterized protein (DUF433 family)
MKEEISYMATTKIPKNGAQKNGKIRKRRLPLPVEIGGYLISDPEVYHGELTFKGTRIPVRTVLTFLGMGENVDELLKGYPSLCREAIQEGIQFAKATLVTRLEPENGRKLKLMV